MNIREEQSYTNYKSRDGRKVVILNTNGPDKDHPIVVAYSTESGGWTYDSVSNEGKEFGGNLAGIMDSPNDLEEVKEITVKQTFIWKGTVEALQGQLGGTLENNHFPDGSSVSEFREVIE